MRTDLVSAFMLLTRLPVRGCTAADAPPDLARSVWAFPIVGAAVNGIGGLVYWLAHRIGMTPLLASVWSLAAVIAVTGALHEDGLADTADGFGGGATPARKMEIMRDSRIGSYGAVALLLSLAMRIAAVAALVQPAIVIKALIVAGVLGRVGMGLLLLLLPPARADGMGASVGSPRMASVGWAVGLAIAAALLLLPFRLAVWAVLLGVGAVLAVARVAAAQIGGHTGDVLGACEVITECMVLSVIVAARVP